MEAFRQAMQSKTPFKRGPIYPGSFFTWEEFTRLGSSGLYAIPTPQQEARAIDFIKDVDPIRREWGRPLWVTSGARTREYTLALRRRGIMAALQGAHLDWIGIDLWDSGGDNAGLWELCRKRWLGRAEIRSKKVKHVHLDKRVWGRFTPFNP